MVIRLQSTIRSHAQRHRISLGRQRADSRNGLVGEREEKPSRIAIARQFSDGYRS
jgi:hypothetical protein